MKKILKKISWLETLYGVKVQYIVTNKEDFYLNENLEVSKTTMKKNSRIYAVIDITDKVNEA
jgi:hypothetical protein